MSAFVPLLPASVEVLAPYVDAGLFGPAEIQLAAAVAHLAPEVHPHVLLATAVAARAPRLGHVGIELAAVNRRMLDRHQEDLVDVAWPDTASWAATLAASPVVASPGEASNEPLLPLVWDGTRIYLQRYWEYERLVAQDLRTRGASESVERLADPVSRAEILDRLFPPDPDGETNLQRVAAEAALTSRLSVIAGGPGTGKTRTVARLLAAAVIEARQEGRVLEVALTAPTGKAAARMTEAVRGAVGDMSHEIPADIAEVLLNQEAGTIHRLLGWRPGGRFRHDALEPLTQDLVVVDETSMVSLPLMARLLSAVRSDARLVLVGDPNQLASVEAGTVLGDVVGTGSGSGPLSGRVTVLRRSHRFGSDSGIADLAAAIKAGDADATVALLSGSQPDVHWVTPDSQAARTALEADVTAAAIEVVRAALAGDAEAGLTAAVNIKVL
ncbi:MAG: AAA family ATPase, partial [Aquihabitans sp.]